MDEGSRQVARFLSAVSANLWGDALYAGDNGLWRQLQRKGFSPNRPSLIVTASDPVSLALEVVVMVTPEQEMDFGVYAAPHADGWRIKTLVFVDVPPDQEGNQTLVREFPERRAATLDGCLTELAAAVSDLAACADAADAHRRDR